MGLTVFKLSAVEWKQLMKMKVGIEAISPWGFFPLRKYEARFSGREDGLTVGRERSK